MSFLKRYKVLVGLTAVFALAIGGTQLMGGPCSNGSCVLSSIFGSSTAYAGPGCSASASKAEGASCTGKMEASATSSASCSAACKEKCVAKLMKDKGLTREQAEASFAADMSAKSTDATVSTAAATSGCAGHASVTTAAVATSVDAKTCAGGKEACIAKCMAEKGMTRAQAEECYAKCQTSKAEGKTCHSGGVNMVQTAVASDGTPLHSREACIDACVAKGMSKAQAEACADKCGASGFHSAAAIQSTDSKAAGCAGMKTSATAGKAGCCAKAKGSASEASTTAPSATDAKTTTTEAPSGGTK